MRHPHTTSPATVFDIIRVPNENTRTINLSKLSQVNYARIGALIIPALFCMLIVYFIISIFS